MKNKPKIIVIIGQTSTGKSNFAVQIALQLSSGQAKTKCEIISADSRQVYKGMNLGTGKITKKEMRGIPHHLLDVASPSRTFTVSQFQIATKSAIAKIVTKGKVPILCGGTGFYIDAVVNNMVLPKVKPNLKLRKELSKKSKEELFKILKKIDPERIKTIDKNNPVRLIRAIEIAEALGKVPVVRQGLTTELRTSPPTPSPYKGEGQDSKYDVLKIGLTLPDEILKEKIYNRILARIKKGMLKEIQNLHDNGLSWKRMEALGLEYRYGALFLQGKTSKQEMIEKLNTESWHYAKRQKTWFKRDTATLWIDPREIHEQAKALKAVRDFLR